MELFASADTQSPSPPRGCEPEVQKQVSLIGLGPMEEKPSNGCPVCCPAALEGCNAWCTSSARSEVRVRSGPYYLVPCWALGIHEHDLELAPNFVVASDWVGWPYPLLICDDFH